MKIELIRKKGGSGEGEITIKDGGKIVKFQTLELDYIKNKNNISCVPSLDYKLIKFKSPRFGWAVALSLDGKSVEMNFKGLIDKQINQFRSYILVHAGNTKSDTMGCILIALDRYDSGALRCSRAAVTDFNKMVFDAIERGEEVILSIKYQK